MVRTDFDAERTYDDERFSAQTVFETERSKTVLAYFEPGQFVPVHAPDSDVTIAVQSGTALVRHGTSEHEVEPGDVVAVESGRDRGVLAVGDERVEALLVVSPPPGDAEHEPVRRGIRTDEFDPDGE